MQHTSELKCVMSRRDWGMALGGLVLLVGAAVLVGQMGGSVGAILAGIVALGALACLGWVALGRRVCLRADAEGLTYQRRWSAQSISWKRLSSLQFKGSSKSDRATAIVVVNDMGRKDMHIVVDDFGRQRLHDFVADLPVRSTGRQRLLS